LAFKLPPELEASEPPEARGLSRDAVRLLVSYRGDNRVDHTRFDQLPDFLTAGDVLVINTSGTLNAALPAARADGSAIELHLSTRLPDEGASHHAYAASTGWVVELRQLGPNGTKPLLDARPGERIALPNGGEARLIAPYQRHAQPDGESATESAAEWLVGEPAKHAFVSGTRLWVAEMCLPVDVAGYLTQYGFPIRYGYVKQAWPPAYYQTVYATEMGSAEMPSAGRAFTPELITRLVGQGVQVAPLILHTGVASLEAHEPPYAEFYRVPDATARLVNGVHAAGKRVVAVGTTVVRALETVTNREGVTHSGEGWTRLIITPQRGVRAVDGLLTGFHEPEATHLAMLEAIAGLPHLQVTYAEALRERYLWHEFGDLHLILP
jgi:S-adenosylmethionine:tRNA ribosyltransferase-isomerase